MHLNIHFLLTLQSKKFQINLSLFIDSILLMNIFSQKSTKIYSIITQQNIHVTLICIIFYFEQLMVKIGFSLTITILVVCLAIRCQNALIDWPTLEYNSSDCSGFLRKFQISTDHPADNKTFTIQATVFLKKDIDWQGLSDYNIYRVYSLVNDRLEPIDLKNLRQYATDAGPYKAGDNITLGFNYTFNSSQKACNSSLIFAVGNQDRQNSQFMDILWKMPTPNEIRDKIELQTDIDQPQKQSGYKNFLKKFEKFNLFKNLRKKYKNSGEKIKTWSI